MNSVVTGVHNLRDLCRLVISSNRLNQSSSLLWRSYAEAGLSLLGSRSNDDLVLYPAEVVQLMSCVAAQRHSCAVTDEFLSRLSSVLLEMSGDISVVKWSVLLGSLVKNNKSLSSLWVKSVFNEARKCLCVLLPNARYNGEQILRGKSKFFSRDIPKGCFEPIDLHALCLILLSFSKVPRGEYSNNYNILTSVSEILKEEELLSQMNVKDFSMILKAFHRLDFELSENIVTNMTKNIQQNLNNLTAPELCTVLHSYTHYRLGVCIHVKFLTLITYHLQTKIPMLKCSDIAQSLSSFAKLSETSYFKKQDPSKNSVFYPTEFIRQIIPQTLTHIPLCSSRELAIITRALIILKGTQTAGDWSEIFLIVFDSIKKEVGNLLKDAERRKFIKPSDFIQINKWLSNGGVLDNKSYEQTIDFISNNLKLNLHDLSDLLPIFLTKGISNDSLGIKVQKELLSNLQDKDYSLKPLAKITRFLSKSGLSISSNVWMALFNHLELNYHKFSKTECLNIFEGLQTLNRKKSTHSNPLLASSSKKLTETFLSQRLLQDISSLAYSELVEIMHSISRNDKVELSDVSELLNEIITRRRGVVNPCIRNEAKVFSSLALLMHASKELKRKYFSIENSHIIISFISNLTEKSESLPLNLAIEVLDVLWIFPNYRAAISLLIDSLIIKVSHEQSPTPSQLLAVFQALAKLDGGDLNLEEFLLSTHKAIETHPPLPLTAVKTLLNCWVKLRIRDGALIVKLLTPHCFEIELLNQKIRIIPKFEDVTILNYLIVLDLHNYTPWKVPLPSDLHSARNLLKKP